jgi:hypothetical protein
MPRYWRRILGPEVTAMRKVEELEQQIQKLSREEFAELRDWFLEQDWKAWDAQIEDDAKSGKLDELISEGQAEYKSGRARKL